MSRYVLGEPVAAAFWMGTNVDALNQLGDHRERLRIDGDAVTGHDPVLISGRPRHGEMLVVQPGTWIVNLGGELVTMTPQAFDAAFGPTEAAPGDR